MNRLICVSNRVGPLADSAKAGGLAVGLVDALKENGGVWFGWSGDVTEQGTFGPMKLEEQGKVSLATIDISPVDYAEFYAGYTNRTLWPLFHYRLDIADYDRRFEEAYRRVNQRFAVRLKPLIQPNDIIWVHDYHFLLLGCELRELGIENPIGFFLHIPFPPPEILTALPRAHTLVRALFSFDLVGFQTDSDCRSFVRFATDELNGRDLGEGRVSVNNMATTAGAFPIGINGEAFADMAKSDEAVQQETRLKRILMDRSQIIGVDRLEYTKGLVQRFLAFERLLEDYPANRGRVSLMQIAPPSRAELDAYADLRRQLEGEIGRINGRFADTDWTPIRFLARPFQRKALAGLLRASRVGLVTPLRDGMNLVAKEYIAAQNPANPGVLVLSRFAGAAEEMREALIVNPYDVEGVAEALQRALHMPLDERKARWNALNRRICENGAATWRAKYLDALDLAARARAA